ncbi:hypothetical protein GSI_03029 [Ganoderma sinense ZZ0214-1]|uniref:Uncharacterized protein n=1 Tax=Ganoderma sinense ZZ0214-1 TaxID=1077348 RepID=A0A2G8SNB6_9APHY|nr:hypothetical protein GSI_03029 [Ganoderma sinense ZZ0214-1]
MDLYSSWSHPRSHKSVLPTSLQRNPNISCPIPIPRRQSGNLPPCSPTRGQGSPELVFNFDLSVSPDGSDETTHVQPHNRSTSVRRPPRQKTLYTPLAILGTNHQNIAHPYAHEPFLYPIPKLPLCDEGGMCTHKSDIQANQAAAKEQIAPMPPPARISSIPLLSSLSSFHSSDPSYPPSDSSWPLGTDGDSFLSSAFHESVVPSTITSPSVSFQDMEPSLLPPPTLRQEPSPPRLLPSDMHTQQTVPNRRVTLHRTTTAAPIVSLSIAQAERSHRPLRMGRGGRSRSPGLGSCRVPPRPRRSSSASAGLGLEKFREPGRHLGTVIGRGASRVISMFEYGYAGARSLVSDEDIERSLEKDPVSRLPGADRGRKREDQHEKDSVQGSGNPVLERGRPRAPCFRSGCS